jgi:hypothetical protein
LRKAGAFGDDGFDGAGPLLMAAHALEAAADGPAAVAVHDDGDVARESLGADLGEVIAKGGGHTRASVADWRAHASWLMAAMDYLGFAGHLPLSRTNALAP